MTNVIPFPQRRVTLYMAGIATATLVLGGCVYIPGSVMGKVEDSLSGKEGQHCVSRETHVGDRLSLPEGGMGEVVRLEGLTPRCKSPRPIRAKLVPVASA